MSSLPKAHRVLKFKSWSFTKTHQINKFSLLGLVKILFQVIGFMVIGMGAFAQLPIPSDGKLPTQNFNPSQFPSREGQCHDVIVGPDHRIYVGNNGGLLVYNGQNWKQVEDPEEREVFALEFSPHGTLFFGSNNSFGYVETDEAGNSKMVDLFKMLGDNLGSIGRIRGILFRGDEVWFYSASAIFVIDKGFQLVEEFAVNKMARLFMAGRRPVVFELFEEPKIIDESGNLVPLINDWPRKMAIQNVFELGKGQYLMITDTDWKYLEVDGNQISTTQALSNPELLDLFVLKARLDPSGDLVLATESNGILKLDQHGNLITISDFKKGLQNNSVNEICFDHQGNLWAALEFGVSMIDYNAPVSHFGEEFGVNFVINEILPIRETLLLGTTTGIYEWNPLEKRFKKVEGFNGECWTLEKVEKGDGKYSILAGAENAITEYTPGQGFERLVSASPFLIRRSRNDGHRYWVGTESGYISFYLKDGFLVEEHRNEALNMEIRSIETDGEGNIYMGSDGYGMIRIRIDEQTNIPDFENLIHIDSLSGLSIGDPNPSLYKDQIIAGTVDGIFLPEKDDRFSRTDFGLEEENAWNNYFFRLTQGPAGELWVVSLNLELDEFFNGYIIPQEKFVHEAFKATTENIVFSIEVDPVYENVWMGGEGGLFGVNNMGENYLTYKVECHFDEISYGEDSILFAGFSTTPPPDIELPFSRKALTFQFSSSSYKSNQKTLFKYKLEGFDDSWSEWSEKSEVVYTNLPGKNYSMQVRTRDYFGVESQVASMNFRVLPPWYLTWWAYSLYGIFFFGFTYAVVVISNRGLRIIIREKTKEITQQKDEIELQNSELESQNEEILAQRDQLEEQNQVIGNKNRQITDSIHYAQRIQLAILPPPSKIKELLPNSSIMYRPKDIVSGDFYWMETGRGNQEEKTLFAAVDCTGHGVPGAFVSIIGYNGLNRVVREAEIQSTGEILDHLNEIVTKTLNPSGGNDEEVKDGMDISLCSLDPKTLEVQYSGAHNSLYLVRRSSRIQTTSGETINPNLEGEHGANLFEIKADKRPIGAFEKEGRFNTTTFQAEKDDLIFLFTDGFADQFGGPKGKKYMYKSFKKFLIRQVEEPVAQINSNLEKEYDEWKGEHEQIDDVCIIAVRV